MVGLGAGTPSNRELRQSGYGFDNGGQLKKGIA